MDMTKKLSKSVVKKASTIEDFVLRMDISVEGMELVKSVPVQLSGIRSYPLVFVSKKKGRKDKLSLIVSVKTKAGGKIHQVSFESPVLISNNCFFPLDIGAAHESQLKKAKEGMNTLRIEPNKTFNVPLQWLIDDN